MISIHAPVRERPLGSIHAQPGRYFNSRSREGATFVLGLVKKSTGDFNSRSREGATRWPSPTSSRLPNFNSRSREGATAQQGLRCDGCLISIHAPVRERPACLRIRQSLLTISIHAPVRERPRCAARYNLRVNFNSRSREGATSSRRSHRVHLPFQFTLP